MNTTTRTHRLYTVLALMTGMVLVLVTPVAAGVDEPSPDREARELDGWIYGRGAATYDGSGTSQNAPREDGWVRGGGLKSLSGAERRLPVDGWAIGQGMRSQTTQPATAATQEQPSPRPIPLPTIIAGLLLAAGLGAAAAATVSHRGGVPSAH